VQKTVEHIFKILILKFLANFVIFTFALSLWSSSSGAIWAKRPVLVTFLWSCVAYQPWCDEKWVGCFNGE